MRRGNRQNSGVALQTYADIEIDGFQTQVDNRLKLYENIAKGVIKYFDKDKELIPENDYDITFADVVKQEKLFKIQFSAASPLSRDPQTKVAQIIQMVSQGLIPLHRAANYLDMPDLDDAYSFSSAVYDGVSKVIENAIERGEIDIPEYISYDVLSTEIAQLQNILWASDNDGDKKRLDRLNDLDAALLEIMTKNGVLQIGSPIAAGSINAEGVDVQQANEAQLVSPENMQAAAMQQAQAVQN